MRAKTVHSNAWVFDFDDTLVRTDAKIHIYKSGRRIYSLTPEEYNKYVPKPGETINNDDFADPRIIMNARKYKMWPELKRVDMANKMGKLTDDIYILTARDHRAELPIYAFLSREGINIPRDNVIGVGEVKQEDREGMSGAERKGMVLKELTNKYDTVYFFDDSQDNIDKAREIPRVETRLIEMYKIIK